jgi:hypothetical protein
MKLILHEERHYWFFREKQIVLIYATATYAKPWTTGIRLNKCFEYSEYIHHNDPVQQV